MSLDIRDLKFIVCEAKGLSHLKTDLDDEARMEHLVELVVNEIKKKAIRGFSSLTIGTSTKCTVHAKVGTRVGDKEMPHVKFRNDFIQTMRDLGCDCSNSMHSDDDTITVWW